MSEEYQSREERRKQQNAAKNKHKSNKKSKGSLFKRILLVLVTLVLSESLPVQQHLLS